MSMRPFFGHRDHRIDSKDRVVIPRNFAEAIEKHSGGLVYLVPASNRLCVQVYPATVYDAMAEGIKVDPLGEDSMAERRFFERAQDVELKGPGRITLPKPLITRYFPKGVVRIAGKNQCLELWDPERWEQHVGDGDPVGEPTTSEPAD